MSPEQARQAVAAIRRVAGSHEPASGAAQWYVDEHVIDCDAGEFWAMAEQALRDGA